MMALALLAGLSSWTPMNSPDSIRDCDVSFLFLVMVNFVPIGEFDSVTGLTRSMNTEEIVEGGANYSPRTVIKQGKAGRVTLKWGLMDRDFLYEWANFVEVGHPFRLEVTIIQFQRGYIPVRIYHFEDAFPISWKGANLESGNSSAAIEEIELAYEKLDTVVIGIPSFAPVALMLMM